MIFTECTKCDVPFNYPYESGDKPCGTGIYGLHVCENCGQRNCVERVSIGGETISEKDLFEKGGVRSY